MFVLEIFWLTLVLGFIGQLFFAVLRAKSAYEKLGPEFEFKIFVKNNWFIFTCNLILIFGLAIGNAFGSFIVEPVALISAGVGIEAIIQKLFGK